MKGINSRAVSVICHGARICNATLVELRKIDRKTEKLMTFNGGMHHRTGVKDALYMKVLATRKS